MKYRSYVLFLSVAAAPVAVAAGSDVESSGVAKPEKLAAADNKISGGAPEKKADATPVLKKMTVTGEKYEERSDYNPVSTTATKTDTPLMETPISIQTVSRAVMDDQQAIRLDDATQNVSGVQGMRQLGVLFDNFIIRGFTSSSFNVYRDGLRLGQQSFETGNLERIDILKGPASTLFGRSAPGGLVNMVTKKPSTDPYYSITQQFGSYDLYRTVAEATGALTNDKSLAYRLNVVYSDSNSFRDFVSSDRIFVAPQLTWKPTDQFEVNFGYEYKKDYITGDRGIPAVGNRPASVPLSRFIGEPDFAQQEAESHLAHLTWTYKINEDWKVQQRFATNILDTLNRNIIPISLQADNRTINRGLFYGLVHRNTYASDINLNGKFDLFSMRHNVLFGFDYLKFDQDRAGTFLASAPFITPLDLYNPVYGTVRLPANLAKNNYVVSNDEWFGMYFQDQVDLTKALHLLFSGRHDWARNSTGSGPVSGPSLNSVSTEKFSPRVGLVYEPAKWVSLFANWTEALGANNGGLSASGQPFAPEWAEQVEGGVKTEFFDGRLSSTLAIYQLVKENVLTADTSTPNPIDQIAIGKARSQGLEFDMTGKITDKLSLIGSYAYTDTKVLVNNNGLQGKQLPGVPEHSGSLWLNYEVMEGWKIGSGAYISGQRQANVANDFQLPGYTRWDAMTSYQWKVSDAKVTAQVNVNNILDKRYFAYADQFGNARFDAMPGSPRTVMGSIRVEY